MKNLVYITFLFLLIGCKNQPKDNIGLEVPIKILDIKGNQHRELMKNCIDSISFLKLKETEGSFLITINKLIIKEGQIFIFDRMGKNSLISFDLKGDFITKFGTQGNALNEYIHLWDFDVDSNYVYLYDRAKQKMLYYTHTGLFVKSCTTPFRGDGFKVVNGNKILFSLAKEENLNKLILVDSLMTITERILNYDEKYLDDKITDNLFQEINDTIFYNKAINDTVYAFSNNGELLECYYFNFNKNNVPEKEKYSYDELLKNKGKEKYIYMYDCPMFINGKVIGSIFNKGNKATFMYDIKSKQSGIADWVNGIELKNIILPIYTNSKYIVGWMDKSVYDIISDKMEIPTALLEHMNDGGRVLVFYHLK